MAKGREAVVRLGLILGSLLLVFAGAELVLAVAFPHYGRSIHVSDRNVRAGLDCYPSNPRGYFDLDLRDRATFERFRKAKVRNLKVCAEQVPYAVELRYNRLQFRGPDPEPRMAGVRRVAVLGDSFTEGQGVREADIYPRVMERWLVGQGRGGWEVLNFGRRGADFPALLENFEQLLSYTPDVVVYALMLNDAEQAEDFRSRYEFVNERVMGLPGEGPDERRGPFYPRLATWIHTRIDRLRRERATTRWYQELYGEPNQEGWERTQAYIREMDTRVRRQGGEFLLVTWPVLAALEGSYPFLSTHEAIHRFARAARIRQHDLLSVLRRRPTASLWVHEVDHHPNETAHRLAGESIAAEVLAIAEGAHRR